MAKRKPLTEAQKQARKRERNITRAYKRQRERIITTIAEQQAMGGVYPDTFKIPAIPKKITEASVRRLKKITNISLINKAYYIRPETGEAVRGTRGRQIALQSLDNIPSARTRKAQDYFKERAKELRPHAGPTTLKQLRKKYQSRQELDAFIESQGNQITGAVIPKDSWTPEERLEESRKRSLKIVNENRNTFGEYESRVLELKLRETDEYKGLHRDISWNDERWEREKQRIDNEELQKDLDTYEYDDEGNVTGSTEPEYDEPYIGQDSTDYGDYDDEDYWNPQDEIEPEHYDTPWEQEETDDERIRRSFQESLDRQDAEAEEEKRKEEARQEYIEKLKRLHDKDLEERRKESERYSSRPVSETDNVLGYIEEEIRNWEPKDTWSKDLATRKQNQVESLKTRLDGAIRRDGREAIARKLQNNSEEIYHMITYIFYGSPPSKDQFYQDLNRQSGEIVSFGNIIDKDLDYNSRKALSEEMEEDEYEEYEE